jgi:hypothetical protein
MGHGPKKEILVEMETWERGLSDGHEVYLEK